MREIEFRAWLKNDKRMTKVQEIYLNETGVIGFKERNEDSNYDSLRHYKDFELMLGLKIYSDEVVFIGDVVRIYGGEQMFGLYEVDKIKVVKDLEDLLTLCNMDYGIDVLGNIYENPKLLEIK